MVQPTNPNTHSYKQAPCQNYIICSLTFMFDSRHLKLEFQLNSNPITVRKNWWAANNISDFIWETRLGDLDWWKYRSIILLCSLNPYTVSFKNIPVNIVFILRKSVSGICMPLSRFYPNHSWSTLKFQIVSELCLKEFPDDWVTLIRFEVFVSLIWNSFYFSHIHNHSKYK